MEEESENSQRFYDDEEENIKCGRFPHSQFCGCTTPCNVSMKDAEIIEVFPGIYIGCLETAYCTRRLLDLKVSHIINVSCVEYFKRVRYFKYLDIPCYDSHSEVIRKYFRITNRFITEAIDNNGAVLIHCIAGKSRSPTLVLAYFIGKQKIAFREGLTHLKKAKVRVDINEAFVRQLEDYDLEKLAIYREQKV